MGADGGEARRLPIVGSLLSRGPGDRIAYLSGDRLLVAADDGHGARFLARVNPGVEESTPPAWSPDGRSLAVGAGSGCDPTGTCSRWTVWVVSARSGAKRRLVSDGAAPSWASDGRHLTYEGGFANGGVRPGGPEKVFVVDTDGRNARPIARGELPRWQPHGARIAYTARKGIAITGIRTVDATGRDDRAVGSGGTEFAWSPDGKHLAYVGPYPLEDSLYVVAAAGGHARRIGRASGEGVGALAWSPDSSKLAWITYDAARNRDDLLVASATGAAAPRIVAHQPRGSSIGTPLFTRDGTRVLFVVR